MADVMRGGINAGMITNTNVSYTKPTSGQVLKYNATTDLWEPGADSTDTNATQLQGVDICTTAPNNGEVLTYDSATSKWCPAVSGGGGKIVQVVTSLNDFQYSMPNSYSTTGSYANITPTSDSNKLLLFASVPTRGGDQYTEFSITYFRHSASQTAGSTPSGTDMFPDAWPGGINMDSQWPTVNNSYLNAFIPLNIADSTYGTTSEVFYNLAVKVVSNSYPAEIPSQMWTTILMEVDES